MADVRMDPFAIWGHLGAAWSEAAAELGSEVMHFIAARMQEDVAAQERLLRCRTPEEMRHVQAAFVQAAIDQYVAETGRLVKLSEDLAARFGATRST